MTEQSKAAVQVSTPTIGGTVDTVPAQLARTLDDVFPGTLLAQTHSGRGPHNLILVRFWQTEVGTQASGLGNCRARRAYSPTGAK